VKSVLVFEPEGGACVRGRYQTFRQCEFPGLRGWRGLRDPRGFRSRGHHTGTPVMYLATRIHHINKAYFRELCAEWDSPNQYHMTIRSDDQPPLQPPLQARGIILLAPPRALFQPTCYTTGNMTRGVDLPLRPLTIAGKQAWCLASARAH
jgi:hypothetical protein